MKQKAIYVAGPMSGYPEFNFPAFTRAQTILEASGWKVWNPASKEQEKGLDVEAYRDGDAKKAINAGFDFRECYLWDMDKVIMSDAIYMLKGWENSPGARGEHAAAVAMQKYYPEYAIIYQ